VDNPSPLQYESFDIFFISLMFIVVCFLSGSRAVPRQTLRDISLLTTPLYSKNISLVDEEIFETFSYVLLHHDVHGTLTLPLAEDSFENSLQSIRKITEELTSRNVAPEFYSIIFDSTHVSEALLRIEKDSR
jgi:hypothetical protein